MISPAMYNEVLRDEMGEDGHTTLSAEASLGLLASDPGTSAIGWLRSASSSHIPQASLLVSLVTIISTSAIRINSCYIEDLFLTV